MSVPKDPFGWTKATVVPREPGRGAASMALPPAATTASSATPIDEAPRPGSRGTTVAFIHPKGSFGTLIELVQE